MKHQPFEHLASFKVKKKAVATKDVIRRRPKQIADAVQVAPQVNVSYEINSILKKCVGTLRLEGEDNGIVAIKLKRPRPTPSLPAGYYFKGGVARETLRAALFPKKQEIPFRDRDVVRFADAGDKHDHDLSLKHMYEDYCFGRGVEVVEDNNAYFAHRDITINEVLYRYPLITCTKQALIDLSQGVLRASKYRTKIDGTVEPNTAVKMLRLKAEATVLNYPCSIINLQKPLVASWFDISLQLNRSLVMGEGVTLEFITLLWLQGVFGEFFQAPPPLEKLVLFLAARIPQGITFFSNVPVEVLRSIT